MQLAHILQPDENLSYVIQKFKELLPETVEELKSNSKDLKAFEQKLD